MGVKVLAIERDRGAKSRYFEPGLDLAGVSSATYFGTALSPF